MNSYYSNTHHCLTSTRITLLHFPSSCYPLDKATDNTDNFLTSKRLLLYRGRALLHSSIHKVAVRIASNRLLSLTIYTHMRIQHHTSTGRMVISEKTIAYRVLKYIESIPNKRPLVNICGL